MNDATSTNEVQHPGVQQQKEQIEALTAEAERASDRMQAAREGFQQVAMTAAGALTMPPNSPQGQILQQALMAAFQWGFETSEASDQAAQRREEVTLLQKIAKASEDELRESRARRDKQAEDSAALVLSMGRLADSHEKLIALTEKQVAMLEHASRQDAKSDSVRAE